jgi:hypothetical protein
LTSHQIVKPSKTQNHIKQMSVRSCT